MFHVLVADNKGVRVFETSARGGRLDELAVFHNRGAQRHERDLITSRPGRAANRPAGIRQAYEPKMSAKDQVRGRWLASLGRQLQLLLESHHSDALVLVAAPRLLSELRGHLPARVRKLIHAELPRDLAKLPIAELTQRLQPTLRAAAHETSRSQPVYRAARASKSRTS